VSGLKPHFEQFNQGATMTVRKTANPAERRRIIFASLVGTTIEFYDFYIYATAAVSVFPLLFFASGEGRAALLASMATFGVAFVARPLGSIVFGHFGDRIGRKATLVGSLLLMGLATFAIGFLPTYHRIGLFAPALLAGLRFCQGLGLGGEWSGAALLATETAEPGRRARAAMWPQLGAPFGFILANGFFLLLAVAFNFDSTHDTRDDHFLTWGWRIPFLLSIVMVVLGLYVRVKLHETPIFAGAVERGETLKAPLIQVFRANFKELILGTFIMVATYGLFYIMTTWILSYAIGKVELGCLGIGYRDFLVLQLISVLFFAAFIPVAGHLADRIGRRTFLLAVTAVIVIYGISFRTFLSPESMGSGGNANKVLMLVFLSLGMALMGLSFGPMSALLPELFPTNTRYTGSGVAYNMASILGAALTPFVATWLAQEHGPGSVGVYLALLAMVSFVALFVSKETKFTNLDTMTSEATAGIEATSP
jgi:MFS family permease